MEAGPGAALGQGPVTLDTVRAPNEGESVPHGHGMTVKKKTQRLNLERS